jgi:hypothetical protein
VSEPAVCIDGRDETAEILDMGEGAKVAPESSDEIGPPNRHDRVREIGAADSEEGWQQPVNAANIESPE